MAGLADVDGFKTVCCQASDPCTIDHRSFTSLNTNTRLYVLSINSKCYDVNMVNKVGNIKDLIRLINAGFLRNKEFLVFDAYFGVFFKGLSKTFGTDEEIKRI